MGQTHTSFKLPWRQRAGMFPSSTPFATTACQSGCCHRAWKITTDQDWWTHTGRDWVVGVINQQSDQKTLGSASNSDYNRSDHNNQENHDKKINQMKTHFSNNHPQNPDISDCTNLPSTALETEKKLRWSGAPCSRWVPSTRTPTGPTSSLQSAIQANKMKAKYKSEPWMG